MAGVLWRMGSLHTATAPDVAGPYNDNLIFENRALHLAGFKMQSIRQWTGNTADQEGAEMQDQGHQFRI